jgi:hypothetical protein
VIFYTYKNNEKIIRSASAVAQSKCVFFLFAYWSVSDCFCGKVDAIDLKERQCFGLVNFIFRNGMASAFPLKQLLLVFWQIKNHTLAGFS